MQKICTIDCYDLIGMTNLLLIYMRNILNHVGLQSGININNIHNIYETE